MLARDPARVVVLDLSAAQIECPTIRIAAFRTLDHAAIGALRVVPVTSIPLDRGHRSKIDYARLRKLLRGI